MKSIENCDLDSSAIRVDSPHTVQALRRLGLQLEDLQPSRKPDFSVSLLSPQMLSKRMQSYEQRRRQWIEDVKKLRVQLQSHSPAKTSSTSPSSTSRLKPYQLREKHSLQLLRAKRLEQIKLLAEADYFYQQRLSQSQAVAERSCMHQREKKCEGLALPCGNEQVKTSLRQAKKVLLQAKLSSFQTPSKASTQQLEEFTRQVQVAKERLAVHKQASPVRVAQTNVARLVDLRKALLESEKLRKVKLEASFSLKDEAAQERMTYIRQLRTLRIQDFSEKERKRQTHIAHVQQEKEERLRQKSQQVEVRMQTVASKAERAKSLKQEESRQKGVMRLLKHTDTLRNLQRLQRVHDYSRQQVLCRIQEEDLLRMTRQVTKAQQALSRQLLHKQLLTERHAITRDFDRLLSLKGPQFQTGVTALLNRSENGLASWKKHQY